VSQHLFIKNENTGSIGFAEFSFPSTRSRLLILTLSQMNPVHTHTLYLLCILILSFHLYLGLPSGSFHSSFVTNILYVSKICAMRATWMMTMNYVRYNFNYASFTHQPGVQHLLTAVFYSPPAFVFYFHSHVLQQLFFVDFNLTNNVRNI
jgi:hypothetical protein